MLLMRRRNARRLKETIAGAMMSRPDFSFSAAAIAQLVVIRQQYLDHSPDAPPAMLGVFWGWPIDNTGHQTCPGAPTVGYWRRSDFTAEAWSEVVQVDGMDLIFAVMPADRARFEGRVLDYAPDGTFFLQ